MRVPLAACVCGLCMCGLFMWPVYARAACRVLTGECRQDEFSFTGVAGESFATIDKALDERTIGHNPERLNLMKVSVQRCDIHDVYGAMRQPYEGQRAAM
jgi:hypothetical protein